jgi:hypothetical protein
MRHKPFCCKKRVLFSGFLLLLNCVTLAAEGDFLQYSAAIHVHSTLSNGQHEILELARFAVERDIDVLVLTDSFLTRVTYGIWPFDRIGWEGINRVVRAGVRDYGVQEYFAAVQRANEQFPELVVIPGVEVTPYYYWKGAPWSELTLHDFDRHLIVLGLTEEQIENLPVIGNETWDNTRKDWILIAVPLGIFVFGILMLCVNRTPRVRFTHSILKKQKRPWGLALLSMVLSGVLAWNNYPFGRFSDLYLGEHKIAPYQHLIDYVHDRGGVVYWSYPEARYGDVEMGGARMISQAHPEDLLLTDGYHGFEGIYGDHIQVTLPGETWDIALMEYLEGARSNPPFVTTGIDFHYLKETGGWYDLDGGQTLLLLPERSERAVLEALRQGRGYATFQAGKEKLRLYDFSVETVDGAKAFQGDTLVATSPVQVHINLDWLEVSKANDVFQLELIRNGEVVENIEQDLPVEVTFEQDLAAGRYYFRLRAWSGGTYQILSNPLFVTVN